MNDPLRDDRIFPKETKKQVAPQKETSETRKNFFVLLAILVLIALAIFLYYKFGPSSPHDGVLPEEEQLNILESTVQGQTPFTDEHRERTIEDMLRSSI